MDTDNKNLDKVSVLIKIFSLIPLIPAFLFTKFFRHSMRENWYYPWFWIQSVGSIGIILIWIIIAIGIFRIQSWARIACLWLMWSAFLQYFYILYAVSFGGKIGIFLVLLSFTPVLIATIFLNNPIVKQKFKDSL